MTTAFLYGLATLLALVQDLRRGSRAGRARFEEMDVARAQKQVELYRVRWLRGIFLAQAAFAAAAGAFSAADGDTLSAAACVLLVVVAAAAWIVRGRVAPLVLADAAARDLPEPSTVVVGPRDRSATRARRQRQLGALALALFIVGGLLLGLGGTLADAPLEVAGGVVMLAAVLPLLALGWAFVWVYGDEEPARSPQL